MMVGLSVTVVVGVTYRWAGQALVWYDEVAAIQLAWLTYYGAAYASLKGAHIGVPSIIKAFPKIIRQYLFVLSKIVIYSFYGLLAYYGTVVIIVIQGETLTTLEWVPQSFVQSVIPVCAVLILISETLYLKTDYDNVMEDKA